MNLRIRRLGLVLGLVYLALFAQLNRVQFFGAERLQDDVNNTRGLIREFGRARGPIVTADGVVVARSVEYDGSVDFRREYPEADRYAHIVGYQSLKVAATGLERSYNDELAGDPTRVGYVARLEAGGSRHSQVMDFVAYVRARRYLNNAHEAAMAAGLDRCSARSSSPEQGILRPLPTPPERTWHRRRPCQTKRPSCPNDSVSRAPTGATASAPGV